MDSSQPFASPATASMFSRFMASGLDMNHFIDSLTTEEMRTLKNMARKGAGRSEKATMTDKEARHYRIQLKYDKAYRDKTLDEIAKFSGRARFAVGIARTALAFWS